MYLYLYSPPRRELRAHVTLLVCLLTFRAMFEVAFPLPGCFSAMREMSAAEIRLENVCRLLSRSARANIPTDLYEILNEHVAVRSPLLRLSYPAPSAPLIFIFERRLFIAHFSP